MISTTLHRLTKWPSKTTATRKALAKQEVRQFAESIMALSSTKLISTLVISEANEEINILKPEESDLSFILVDISQKCTAEVPKTEQTFLRLMLADQPPPPYFNTFQDILIGFG